MKKIMNEKIISVVLFIMIALFLVVSNFDKSYASIEIENIDGLIDLDEYVNDFFNSKVDISNISELNRSIKPLDSNKEDIATSNWEENYREIIKLDRNTLDVSNSLLDYMVFPRLKKLNDDIGYILTFQVSSNEFHLNNSNKNVDLNNNGINIYYTLSKDLKTWSKPKILFEGYEDIARENPSEILKCGEVNSVIKDLWYLYGNADLVVLEDGTVIVAAAKVPAGNYMQCLKTEDGVWKENSGTSFLKYIDSDIFNNLGIFIKKFKVDMDNETIIPIDSENSIEEQQIYAGYAHEPTFLNLSTGELQLYFTMVAPGAYYKAIDPTFASRGAITRSTGSGMIESLDNGKTWIPNITGTTNKYLDNENNNPYIPYVVAQDYVRFFCDTATCIRQVCGNNFTSDCVEENYRKATAPFDYKTLFNSSTNINFDKGIPYNDSEVKMTFQMPVAVELNNKKRVVMSVETIRLKPTYDTNGNLSNYNQTHTLSLIHTDLKDVTINGKNEKRYWLDIKDSMPTTFNKKEDVYNNTGLGFDNITTKNVILDNSLYSTAPYILQMPSGETIVETSRGTSNGTEIVIYIGDSLGNFKNIQGVRDTTKSVGWINGDFVNYTMSNNSITSGKIVGSTFGSISPLSSHSFSVNTAIHDTNYRYLGIHPIYLNHKIDVKNEKLSINNDDALFIGGESQAQVSIRFMYDKNNFYLIFDGLDEEINEDDKLNLSLKSDSMSESLDFTINIKDNIFNVEEINCNFKIIENGYIGLIKIPLEKFGYTKKINFYAELLGPDNLVDKMTATNKDNIDTWIPLELVTKTNAKIIYDENKSTKEDVVATIEFDHSDVEILNNDGKNTYTFTENGEFEFLYRDKYGSVLKTVAKVDWIINENSDITATIEYNHLTKTSNPVIATVKFDKDDIEILNNDGKNIYTFTENGEFEFLYRDKYGNKGSIVAKVDWIEEKKQNEVKVPKTDSDVSLVKKVLGICIFILSLILFVMYIRRKKIINL